jgi:hypothetical protein
MKVFVAELSDANFVDFYGVDGGTAHDAPGSIVTSYDTTSGTSDGKAVKSGARRKQASYVVTHFNQTESAYVDNGSGLEFDTPSSCLMRARWDFSNATDWGKWSDEWEVYRLNRLSIPQAVGAFTYGRSVVTTRNKVRGSGKAIQLEFTTQPEKDLQLLGWEANYGVSSKF